MTLLPKMIASNYMILKVFDKFLVIFDINQFYRCKEKALSFSY